jgi:probable phosphoglycerate mutase
MTDLYLIRHAADAAPQDGPLGEPGLSPEGTAQAERLRDRLAATKEIPADVLITSPLRSARETAEILAPALGLEARSDEDVREWRNTDGHELGAAEFVGRMMAQPVDQSPYYSPAPDGESWAKFAFRACLALNRIAQEHAGKRIVIVCHGGIVEASFLFAYGLSPLAPLPIMMNVDPVYTSLTHWRKVASTSLARWRLMTYNDAFHLRFALAPMEQQAPK